MAGGLMRAHDGVRRHTGQLFRFGLVGIGNTLIDFIAYTIAVFAGVTPALANVLAFAIANPISYFVNSRVTFRRDAKAATISFGGYGKFLAAHLLSLSVSTGFIWMFADGLGPLRAKAGAIVITLFINYTASAFLVFPNRKSEKPGSSESA